MIETEMLKGFVELAPEKAAKILPGFRKNIEDLSVCYLRKIELLKQIVFHVTLKAHGLESKDVRQYIYETLRKKQRFGAAEGESKYEWVDAVDWNTGYDGSDRYSTISLKKTGRIAGVITRDDPPRIIKFDVPVDKWQNLGDVNTSKAEG